MKIKITKVTAGWWTTGKIGEIFEVVEEIPCYEDEALQGAFEAYRVVTEEGPKFVLKDDCEVFTGDVTEFDAVSHPSHYTAGKIEVIDIIAQTVSGYDDPFVAHSVGTATKYLNRAPYKHASPTEDLKKARAYLDFAIKHLEEKAEEEGD